MSYTITLVIKGKVGPTRLYCVVTTRDGRRSNPVSLACAVDAARALLLSNRPCYIQEYTNPNDPSAEPTQQPLFPDNALDGLKFTKPRRFNT